METTEIFALIILQGFLFYTGVLYGKVLESKVRLDKARDEYIEALEKEIEELRK